jgi:hypothetical protein
VRRRMIFAPVTTATTVEVKSWSPSRTGSAQRQPTRVKDRTSCCAPAGSTDRHIIEHATVATALAIPMSGLIGSKFDLK